MEDKYILAELEDRIIDCVTSYMENVPRPFAILLSGGFDSGLLAALTKPDIAYRIKFKGGVRYDETRYAEAVAKHLGIELIDIEFGEDEFKANFKDAVKTYGELSSHFSLVPLYHLFHGLNIKGVTNVLSGEGPDEYLGGYARQIVVDHIQKLLRIPELRGYQKMVKQWVSWARDPVIDYGVRLGYETEDIVKYQEFWETKKYPLQGIIGKMDMELGVIEKMEQKFAKHFGITLHYPYINNEFAEYCYKLPDNIKIRDGVTKWGFRQICKKYLPGFIMDRSKVGGPVFSVNKTMGWMDNGEFNKTIYLDKQKEILNEK